MGNSSALMVKTSIHISKKLLTVSPAWRLSIFIATKSERNCTVAWAFTVFYPWVIFHEHISCPWHQHTEQSVCGSHVCEALTVSCIFCCCVLYCITHKQTQFNQPTNKHTSLRCFTQRLLYCRTTALTHTHATLSHTSVTSLFTLRCLHPLLFTNGWTRPVTKRMTV